MGMITLAWRIATGPAWILWNGYKGLWWTFGDTHEPAARQAERPGSSLGQAPAGDHAIPAAAAEQSRSFEVTDSGPRPIPAPTRLLAGGFAGTALSSAGMFLVANAAAAAGALPPDRAILAWGWSSVLVAVSSIFMVRAVARRQRKKSGIRSILRTVGEAGRSAADHARRHASAACRWAASQGAPRADHHTVPVGGSRSFVREKAATAAGALRRAWGAIGRPKPATKAAV